jgi:hypothetical protein
MKKFLILLLVFAIGCSALASICLAEDVTPRRDLVDFNGARDIAPAWRTELTDGSPVATITTTTDLVNDVIVDIITDKGGTLVITPLIDSDDLGVEGEPSTTLTIPVSGGVKRDSYTKIAAPNTKIVFTKTEAGTTSGFLLFVKGVGR